jgi:hypothetical protein
MTRLAALGLVMCGLGLQGCALLKPPPKPAPKPTGPILPTYTCMFTDAAPVIDGKLDDAAWRRAEPMELKLAETGGVPRQATAARAVWDEKNLYVCFECQDDDIWAGMTEHDSHIYEQEVVEIFLNENSDGHAYAEFEVSPNNTTLDLFILHPGTGRNFKKLFDYECEGWKTAVNVEGTLSDAPAKGDRDDKRWTVEMAIPFEQMYLAPHHPPQVGDRMRWNLHRIDRAGLRPQDDEFFAWSQTGSGTFHKPDRFGWLEFSK